MRADDPYLQDIVDAADAIGRYVQGVPPERLAEPGLLQDAVLHRLMILASGSA